jgi:hypothetical protein
MAAVKLTHREQVIRLSGVFLMVSPFFNVLISLFFSPDSPNKWSFASYWLFFTASTSLTCLIYGATVLVGLIMLKGRRSSWISVLIILGACILINALQFPKEFAKGKMAASLPLLTNLALFALVYLQEFRQIAEREARGIPRRALRVGGRVVVQFQGVGPWAELLRITDSEIHLKALSAPPADIATRPLEIIIGDIILDAAYRAHQGEEYIFSFSRLEAGTGREVERWLKSAA